MLALLAVVAVAVDFWPEHAEAGNPKQANEEDDYLGVGAHFWYLSYGICGCGACGYGACVFQCGGGVVMKQNAGDVV